MRRWICLSLLLVPLLVSAQSFWDGNATLQRGDASFESGSFAASNSFPPDTQIMVQNVQTGKSTAVTVTKRIEGQSDILVLLSPPAAAALGIAQGSLASVRVTVISRPSAAEATQPSEQAFSLDPDLNPGAAYGEQNPSTAPQSSAAQPEAAQPETAQAATTTQPDTTQQTAQPETAQATTPPQPTEESLTAAQTPTAPTAAPLPTTTPEAPQPEQKPEAAVAQTQPAATTAPATTQTAATTVPAAAQPPARPDAAIIASAEARAPQKQLFLPPRTDEKFAYHPPAKTPAVTQATTETQTAQAATTTPSTPEVTGVIGEHGAAPTSPQPDLQLAEAAAPKESAAQEIVASAPPAPEQPTAGAPELAAPEPLQAEQGVVAQAPVQTEVTGEPAAPPAPGEPPKLALNVPEAPAPATAAQTQPNAAAQTANTAPAANAQPAATAQTPAAAVVKLAKGFYLQLGAFGAEKVAKDLAASLTPTYPTLIVPLPSSGSRVYRVVIGPLNKAESGTLLTWFRVRGFPDAFLKQE
jgi:hypothetical protein